MTGTDVIELDARLVWVLHVGLPVPQPSWGRAEWRELEQEVARRKSRARSRATVVVERAALASAVAELADLNDPTRTETVDLLVALVRDIQQSGVMDAHQPYLIGGLHDFGWPSDPDEGIVEHLIAAGDLGLFDPPGRPRRRALRPVDEDCPPNTRFIELIEPELQMREVRLAPHTGAGAAAPPRVEPTLREQFLEAWEQLLGAIVDKITDELADEGYLEPSPG